ncbi:Alpha/beta hydrolase family protein [Acanthocheilonema viteae]
MSIAVTSMKFEKLIIKRIRQLYQVYNMKFIRYILLVLICSTIIFCMLLARSLSIKASAEDINLLSKVIKQYFIIWRQNHQARNKPSIMQVSAAAGYRTIAIDLPNFSRSRTKSLTPNDHSTFLSLVIKNLNIHKPIIISPSASGSYSIPYVLSNPNKIDGFVPVAPCCVRNDGWENFTVPTLIIYGNQDKAPISTMLLKIPKKNLVIIPDAPHAAYIKKPIDFVTILVNFLYSIHPS